MSLTKEQMEFRRFRVGSSEIGALLGIDPYKTKHDVFLEKVHPSDDGPVEDHRSWGLDVEDAIIAHHVRKQGYKLIFPKVGSVAHRTLPLVCTPDAIAIPANGVGNIAIQAKNDAGHGAIEWGDPGTDDGPLLYVAQATVELGVLLDLGYPMIQNDLTVARRGDPPVFYPVKFDADLFAGLADVAAQFVRDHILTQKPPDAEPSERAEYIRRRWKKDTGPLLAATDDLIAKVQKVRDLKRQTKALSVALTTAENDLKEAIGDAAGIVGLCTYKQQKGSTYMVDKKPGRVLRLAKIKGEDHAESAAES